MKNIIEKIKKRIKEIIENVKKLFTSERVPTSAKVLMYINIGVMTLSVCGVSFIFDPFPFLTLAVYMILKAEETGSKNKKMEVVL